MSICKGVGGKRGRNPKGIFIHNDAGSKNANYAHYKRWLPTHDLGNGFAHYYVCSDGTLQAEDDSNVAWHCRNYDGNTNYLSIEVCQSMGDLATFKKNELKALKLAAKLCKKYGITPNSSTIKLHREVFATACPHRSVEIHGGTVAKTKEYFIKKIKEYMGEKDPGIVFTYAVKLTDGTILPAVKNAMDYAGIRGKKIAALSLKVNKGKVKYRVHVLGGKWLSWKTGYDFKNSKNGYSGNGKKAIDAVQIIYTPTDDIVKKYGKKKVKYHVSPVKGDYYSWQIGTEKTNGQDGYAGDYGKSIDRIQITVK